MNPWANINIKSQDPEIVEIDKYERQLGEIPLTVRQIRQLITGFEVCHFKYRRHLGCIKNSILYLKPYIMLEKIGLYHIRHGEQALKKDKTGRCLRGQKYVRALEKWLAEKTERKDRDDRDFKFEEKIARWLGHKNGEKIRLVRLLKSRLIWDWKLYEKYHREREYKELEFQVCRLDICHYNFPENLNCVLQGIGELKPVRGFEGCGSYNSGIKEVVKKEFSTLNESLKSGSPTGEPNQKEIYKKWLFACLAKTLKEQTGLIEPISGLSYSKYKS